MPCRLSLAVRARDHRGLDGDRRPQAIDAAPLGAGAQRRMAAGGLSWLARNGRRRGPRACGVGRKSRRRHCGKAIEALPSCGPMRPSRGRAGRAPDSPSRRRRGRYGSVQEVRLYGRRNRTPGVQRSGPGHPAQATARPTDTGVCRLRGIGCHSIDAVARPALLAVRLDDRQPPITQPKI